MGKGAVIHSKHTTHVINIGRGAERVHGLKLKGQPHKEQYNFALPSVTSCWMPQSCLEGQRSHQLHGTGQEGLREGMLHRSEVRVDAVLCRTTVVGFKEPSTLSNQGGIPRAYERWGRGGAAVHPALLATITTAIRPSVVQRGTAALHSPKVGVMPYTTKMNIAPPQ